MDNSKKRMAVGIACIAVAVGVGFVGVPLVNRLTVQTVPVVRAKTEIRQGEKITPDMLETVELGKINLPPNTTGDAALVAGAYATTDIKPEDIITGSKLSKSNPMYNLEDGQYLMSVSVKTLADALSGKLQPGDIVTVFAPKASSSAAAGNNTVGSTTNANVSPVELQYVKVAAVSASNGANAGQQTSSTSGTSSNSLPATVTLVVNKQQAASLAQLNQSELHFALVHRGGGQKADDLLKQQASILEGVAQ